jgi:spore coat polysaccharide biosynthesis protein SpsF
VDDQIQSLADQLGVSCFRGSEADVMGRVLQAAQSANADLIVELTGDCPIIDPSIISQAINIYIANNALYVGNAHVRSYPDGMDVQVFSVQTLYDSYQEVTTELEKEHVTLHIRNNPAKFKPIHLVAPEKLSEPNLGLTLDEAVDYELLTKIISHFHPDTGFTCEDVINLLNHNNEWRGLNSSVRRTIID